MSKQYPLMVFFESPVVGNVKGSVQATYRAVNTPNLPTNIVDFKGFDLSIILKLKGVEFSCP